MKVTHPDISTSSPDLDLHVKKFFYEQLHMPNSEIYDQMYVTKMPQPNTVMITLFHHRFKVFLFRVKQELRINSAQVYHDLVINENVTSLNYSLSKKLKSVKKRRSENDLENFEVVYTYQGKVFMKKERTRGNEGTIHITTNYSLHQFLHRLDNSEQRSSTASQLPLIVVAHSPPSLPAEPEANTPEQETYQPLPPAHSK